MPKEKTVNYTQQQTDDLVKAYKLANTEETRASIVDDFAIAYNKKKRSIVAKLSREGVYIKPEKVVREATESKQSIAQNVLNLAEIIGLNVGKLAAIGEHNTKTELLEIKEAFTMLVDAEEIIEDQDSVVV